MEAAEGQEVVAAAEDLSFRVTHRKEVLQVTLPASATVMDLHHKLQELTGIPQEMQKIMFKGGLKDTTKTLAESGIKNGVKMMLMGSKPEAVQALAAAGKAASIAPLVEQVQAQAEKVPMCQEAHHKKVLDKGKPADAEEGLPGTRAALPESLKGLLSGSGSKVRLVFKPMAGEFTIATAERTQKLPLGSFPDATSDPITDHPGYRILGVQMGKTEQSIRYFYWVPEQYVDAIRQALTGRSFGGSGGGGGSGLEDQMMQEAIRRSMME